MPNPITLRRNNDNLQLPNIQDPNYGAMLASQTDNENASNLDMFSVQDYAEDLIYAISGLENEENPIMLFSNLESSFDLNNHEISRKFPTAIWVKDNRLITCMEGATFTKDVTFAPGIEFKSGETLTVEDIKKILIARGIEFSEYHSATPEVTNNQELTNIPETWFGRGNEVFIEALTNLTNKKAIIYPNISGKIVLRFYETPSMSYVIDSRVFAGLTQFDNKILLSIVSTKQIKQRARANEITNSRGISDCDFEPLDYHPLINSFNQVIQFLKMNGYEYHINEGSPEFLSEEAELKQQSL